MISEFRLAKAVRLSFVSEWNHCIANFRIEIVLSEFYGEILELIFFYLLFLKSTLYIYQMELVFVRVEKGETNNHFETHIHIYMQGNNSSGVKTMIIAYFH